LHIKGLLGFQSFYGRGQKWPTDGLDDESLSTPRKRVVLQAGLKEAAGSAIDNPVYPVVQFGRDPDLVGRPFTVIIPVGWFPDYCYYIANVHPLIGIMACDRHHPFSNIERLMIELSTIAMSFNVDKIQRQMAQPNHGYPEAFENPIIFSFICVTLPGLFMWWLLFLLFTTPSIGHVDKAVATKEQEARAWKIRTVAAIIGYVICAFSLSGLWVAFHGLQNPETTLAIIFGGRLNGYLFSVMAPLVLYFNPVMAWGQSWPPGTRPASTFGWVGDNVGVGQWRCEKQRFRAACVQAMGRNDKQALEEQKEQAERDQASAAQAELLLMEQNKSRKKNFLFC
jgi:hypothetical protein